MSLFDAEMTYEDTILPDHAGETYRGYDGLARATERWLEPFESVITDLERIVGTGDRLVSVHGVRAKAQHTRMEFEQSIAYVWTFRDGKVLHLKSYWDPVDALAAAGLEETTDDHVEIAKQMFIWWNVGDREIEWEMIDPDIELHTPLSSTQGVPYRGEEGLRRWIAEIDDQFDEWYMSPDTWTGLGGGRVLILGELHMRGRESGIELDQPMGWLLTFRDGKLWRYEVFAGHDEARRAAGVES